MSDHGHFLGIAAERQPDGLADQAEADDRDVEFVCHENLFLSD
jgi:hypothetical protein